ncbi:MAG: hypothetical protein PSV35_00750 [bacterium]|nr:hypothetical protein [bacterium]
MPKIKDIAIVAKYDGQNPMCGEAPRKGDNFPPMSLAQRIDMESRLFADIKNLMIQAHQTHSQNNKQADTQIEDPDFITRLSTNEFFFYTREPLTINEFENLQNKLAAEAETLSPGVHLVLGSFAVLNSNNQVMSVTPHLTCGPNPTFNFLIKNSLSDIDVRYKDPADDFESLPVLLATTPLPQIPQIKINGVSQSFTFNNVIPCKTPGGEPFLTAIDICLDHNHGVAKANIDVLVKNKPDMLDLPISHMVISNSIRLNSRNCLGPVMHVDPNHSLKQCKLEAVQIKGPTKKGNFGQDEFRIYELEATPCHTLSDAQKFLQDSTKILDYFNNIPANKNLSPLDLLALDDQISDYHHLIKHFNQASTFKEKQSILKELHTEMLPLVFHDVVKSLEQLKFGNNDDEMKQFISAKRNLFNNAGSNEMKQTVLDELNSTLKKLETNQVSSYIKTVADDFRKNANRWTIGMTSKANAIDTAMSKLTIEERCNYLNPDAPKIDSSKEENIFAALAYRRNLFLDSRVEVKDREKMATFKNFKELFLDALNPPNAQAPRSLADVKEPSHNTGENNQHAKTICNSFKNNLKNAKDNTSVKPREEIAASEPSHLKR